IRRSRRTLDLIQAMGFDHVRLSVDPRPMFHARQADQIASDDLGYLDAAVKMILDRGLAVEINIFADGEFKQRLATDDEFVEQFADFWRALARHYATLDADRVFFEILNEPEGKDRYRWYGVEAKLAAAIRDGAPEHTIIATGAHWSDDDDLVFLEPLRDANVIYAFHFYESHIFTHQGATWSSNYWHELKGVPYPSTPENVQAAAAELPDAVHRLAVVRYGLDRWNAARIDAEIGQVAAWATRWNVPVVCNEFGVYRKNAEPKDRVAWLTDVRTALEKRGVGWAMWEYHGGFGVVNTENGQPVPDEATVRALGLTLRPHQSSDNNSRPN
ncbi:MAG TPA: cellulase family glycosylhydrolase, partial [Bryobacteraceae bacterium]|nr:cellulase family glycosylhydrolase [Bryobacteraceae bacterium]